MNSDSCASESRHGQALGSLTSLQRGISLHKASPSRDKTSEVLQTLVKEKCASVDDFHWSKQLRYYWEADLEVGCQAMVPPAPESLQGRSRLGRGSVCDLVGSFGCMVIAAHLFAEHKC